jgi:uncharacterized protein YjdB
VKSMRMSRIASLLLAIVIIAAGIVPMLPGVAVYASETGFTTTGTVYYVDSLVGNDANAGTSPSKAWETLEKLNDTTFQPGDAIQFAAGGTWTGMLHPKGSGNDGLPIRIDKYGEGPKPLIAGDGSDAAIYFYNQEYWEVRNLEITNQADTAGQRRGIHVSGNSGDDWADLREYRHFVFENLDIHSVKGEQGGGWFSGGIIVWSPTYNFAVSDVVVKNNKIYSLDSVGVYLNGASRLFSSGNKIQNNMIYDISADGAVLLNTTNGLIENNVVFDTHKRAGGYHVPLWTWGTENAVIQYNEVFNTYPGGDAMAYDSDYRSIGTKIQYNYSHNNAGGFVLAINDGTNSTNINRDTIIRYNISQNDQHTIFTLAGPIENTLVHNNTVYIPEHSNARVIASGSWGGYAKDTYFYNNMIMNLGTGGYTLGQSTNNVFDSNLYFGNHPPEVLAMDANKVTTEPMLASPGSAKIGRDTVLGYQLLQGSPAIGAGRVIPGNGGLDFWGNPVPAQSRPNIGAYEGPGLDPGNLPPLPPRPEQANLFVNPGFEAGDFSGWGNHYGEAAIVSNNTHTGQYAAHLINAGSGMEQTITGLKPNTMYRVSGYGRATDGGFAALGVKNYGASFKDVRLNSADYAWKELAFQTGSDHTSATIYLYKSSGTGEVHVDDLLLFEYGEVPLPADAPKPPQGELPGKQNLAPSAQLSVSSTNGDFTADMAVDGEKLSYPSRWITASGQSGPHWLQLEWGQAYEIDRVRMWSGQDGNAGRQAADFQIQYWDGTQWLTGASVTGNTRDGFAGQFNDMEFPVITTNKMRIWITKGSAFDDVARVFEIEVWEKFDNNGDPVPISSITVESQSGVNTIKDIGATLQMVAAVLPYNATDKSVIWSVVRENGAATDAATVSTTGLVTALKAGIVKVVATAADGSGVFGESLLYIDFTKNLAPLASLSASSSHENGNFPPSKAVDGIKNQDASRWITNTTLTGPHWFQMEWDKDYEIHNVRIWSGFFGQYGRQIADFQIQYWDGSGWQTAATVTGSTYDGRLNQFHDVMVPAFTTNKMRLYITKGSAYDNIARVFEIEVLGEEHTSSIPVSSITVSGENGASMIHGIGETLQMFATVSPANATDKSITWSVLRENGEATDAATISATGLVTALKAGTVKVVAAANDGFGVSGERILWITVPNPVKSNIAPLAALSASSSHENGNFPPSKAVDGITNQDASRWITNTTLAGTHWFQMEWDTDYVIDTVRIWSGFKGLLSRQIADFQIQHWDGSDWQTTATVTGNTYDGRLNQYNDLVFPAVTTDKMRLYITKGSTYDDVARVFEIEVWGYEIDIPEPSTSVPVTGVSLDKTDVSLHIGMTAVLSAVVTPTNATNQAVIWGSDNPAVAQVDANGTVTAVGTGSAVITATTSDGSMTAVCSVQVVPLPDDIPPTTTVTINKSDINGWYNSDVTMTLLTSEDLSGGGRTEYRIGGEDDWEVYTAPIALTDEGTFLLQFRSTDLVGNREELKQQVIRIDRTPPVFMLRVNGNHLIENGSFDDNMLMTFDAEDTFAGLASAQIEMNGEVYRIDPQASLAAVIDFAGKTGPYLARITMMDLAGNTNEKVFDFNVTTSINSIRSLLNRYMDSGLTGGVLRNNLDQAVHHLDKGREKQAAKHLHNFIKHIDNPAHGKDFSAEQKRILQADANALIRLWTGA